MRNIIFGTLTLLAITLLSKNNIKQVKNHNKKINSSLSIIVDSTKINSLKKQAPEIKIAALKNALVAYKNVEQQHLVKKPILTVIDFSLPSNLPRMWIFDLIKNKLIIKTYVAHGANSGGLVANHFSNQNASHSSSIGTYITKATYYGSKGLSLNLQGLEKGINDHAYERRVVVHGAWYVEPKFIKANGYAGRSWGCPSVAKSLAPKIINTIKNGSVLYAYYPDRNYLLHSKYI